MSKIFRITVQIILMNYFFIEEQDWKNYPYHQPGSLIHFPLDEGNHPTSQTEWWYLNAFVTGQTTGNNYSVMLTYFYQSGSSFNGYRFFNIADDSKSEFYPHSSYCSYTHLSRDYLNIEATNFEGKNEKWITAKDSLGNLIPFEYQISAISPYGSIEIDCNAIKRPLMIGGDGFLRQGVSGLTYYYSLTKLNLSGLLTLKGITEPISGFAWINHQYGELQSTVQERYEWFSIQLSNGMDLNLWSIFNSQNQLPDSLNYSLCTIYIDDQHDTTISNFDLTRLKYSYTKTSSNCYSQKWHFIWENIDLVITTLQPDCEITIPYQIYEGGTTIQGTVDGLPVTGVGFAELLHSYKNPIIEFVNVDTTIIRWHIFQ